MARRQLPANPSLKSLKNQAKQLLHGHRSGATEACGRIVALHPRMADVAPEAVREKPFALADAQLVIAREYGFESWPKMQAELFSDDVHFANEPSWEWALAPHLDRPLFDSGGSCDEGIAFDYDNHRENGRLDVHFAVDERFAERDLRVVGFDEEAKRYLLRQLGSGRSKTLAMYHCALVYEAVPHGTVRHLGIEVRGE